jgi:hypothetical protein
MPHNPSTKRIDWRGVLARLPLPMLALAASYGVYSFALLFVPPIVAGVQAAAFELTYIGLAVTQSLDGAQRKRATTISIGAVVASIVYNTLAGWFHRQPDLLTAGGDLAWLMFAILHGAPLAWVAYLVSDLLLHSAARSRRPAQLRALIKRLARGWRTARAQIAPLQALLAQSRAELEHIRATARERDESAAQTLHDLETAREQLDAARADRAEAHHAAAQLRADLETARAIEGIDRRRLAHLLSANGMATRTIARVIERPEATVRGWLASATNGHAIEV